MKRMVKLIFPFMILSAVLYFSKTAFAYSSSETQDGRYVLVMVSGSNSTGGRSSTKTPAIVLDSVLGIVWNCDNLQTENARWTKTDLAKNNGGSGSTKRYIIKILDLPSSEPKIPAIVLDVVTGTVWTCPNTMDDKPIWIAKDLANDVKEAETPGY